MEESAVLAMIAALTFGAFVLTAAVCAWAYARRDPYAHWVQP